MKSVYIDRVLPLAKVKLVTVNRIIQAPVIVITTRHPGFRRFTVTSHDIQIDGSVENVLGVRFSSQERGSITMETLDNVLRDLNTWVQASEKTLKQKAFWPNRLVWNSTDGSAVGIAFSGSSGDHAVNKELLLYLVEAKRQDRRTECYIAFFERGDSLENSKYQGHVTALELWSLLEGEEPIKGNLGSYWWVDSARAQSVEEIPF
jgi:hypothetical protein